MPTDDRKVQGSSPKRVAIYARYSSDLQRPSSIEDQIRQCRDAAARNGWVVVDEYIRSDAAVSGRSLVGRGGLEDLVSLAETSPRPFDGILIDDTSRFGRNLSDTLPLSDILENASVFLYFANCSLDSRDPNFRLLFIAYGQQDEQYSRRLGEKVHSGQRGQVLQGFVGSGRTYGYVNVPIEDPSRKGLYGRPFVEAVRLEVNPEEAAVVIRIFELYVGGCGCRAIAMKLNKDGIPSALQGQSPVRRIWNTFTVSSILKNEKYHGVHVWNRTKVVRNPRTHCKEQRPRPQSEWERVLIPEWRIVPEHLWALAVEVNRTRRGPSWRKTGGLNRSEASRGYVFSSVMICGICEGNFNVIGGKGGDARYGCKRHRYSGICKNSLTIRREVLEARLLQALSRNARSDEVRAHLSAEFHNQLMVAWKDRRKKARQLSSSAKALRDKQDKLRHQAENLVNAIAATKGSALVYARLDSIETQMRNIDALLATQGKEKMASPSLDDLKSFLDRKLVTLEAVLARNPTMAKQRILKHVGKLIMNPTYPAQGPTYQVTGDLRLFAGNGQGNALPKPSLRTALNLTDGGQLASNAA
jgi:DNA invertase Pin-like site-specific DNA recombinase